MINMMLKLLINLYKTVLCIKRLTRIETELLSLFEETKTDIWVSNKKKIILKPARQVSSQIQSSRTNLFSGQFPFSVCPIPWLVLITFSGREDLIISMCK